VGWITSAIGATASIASFALTFLGKIDHDVGLAAGTTAGVTLCESRKMTTDGLSIGRDFSRYRACGYFLQIPLTSAGGVDIYWASCLLRDETPV
jgi:hypothetical protein